MDRAFLHSLFFDLIIPETIQWATFATLLILVFSPFIVISIKRFRLTKWYIVPFCYIASWFIHDYNFFLIDWITRPLARLSGFTNIVIAMEDSYWYSHTFFFIFWPLSVFYVIKIFRQKFTLGNIIVGIISAILLFIFQWQYLLYEISNGIGGLWPI